VNLFESVKRIATAPLARARLVRQHIIRLAKTVLTNVSFSKSQRKMIISSRFIFLHLHKSGGSFVNEALLQHVSDARCLGYHLPRSLVPEEYRSLPVIGFVRKPWSYYVSWYTFQKSLPQGNHLFRCVSDHGRLDFSQTIRRLLSLCDDVELLEQILAGLPEGYGRSGFNVPRSAFAPIRGAGIGVYSHLYNHIYTGDSGRLLIGRMETLREDLLRFLMQLGVPISQAFRDFILTSGASNQSPHADYRTFYTSELRTLVAERDANIIAQFNYSF